METSIKVGRRACVKIELVCQKRKKKKYHVCDGLLVLREGTEMIPLPENMEILGDKRYRRRKASALWITINTT